MENDKLKDYIQDNREDFDAEAPAPNLWDRISEELEADDEEDHSGQPLRDFVLSNREAFDDATPPPRLADAVFAQLDAEEASTVGAERRGATLRTLPGNQAPLRTEQPPQLRLAHSRRRKLFSALAIAAGIALLIGFAYTLGNQVGYNTAVSSEAQIAAELEKIDPELVETERYFQREIAAQFTAVSQLNDDPQLKRDLAEMDRATAELRAELVEVPVSQRPLLVNELIETYQTKLHILIRIQQQLNPSGEAPRPSDSTSDDAEPADQPYKNDNL